MAENSLWRRRGIHGGRTQEGLSESPELNASGMLMPSCPGDGLRRGELPRYAGQEHQEDYRDRITMDASISGFFFSCRSETIQQGIL